MIKISLNEDEKEILKKHYHSSKTRLIRERAHALLLSNQGESVPQIADILFRAENTIRDWLRAFNEGRISSVFTQYENNLNASKLTKEQREEIKEALNKPPSEYDIPKQFWDVKGLKKYLRAEFNIVYESERSYHFLFKISDYSFKLPSPFDSRRDNEYIEKRIKEIKQEIKPYLEDNKWEILASDETRIVWESEIRKAWLKKGEKTIIKINREREYQNFIGMLNLKTGNPHLYKLNWQNQKTIIASLQKLKKNYENKNICVIWDNAKWHKSKEIRKELSKGNSLENFHLINLPPYAPDKNPQEYIWKYGKDEISNSDSLDSFEDIIKKFQRNILKRKFNYTI